MRGDVFRQSTSDGNRHVEDGGLQVMRLFEFENSVPPPPKEISDLWWSPPPHPQLWGACGNSENWDRKPRIDTVRVLLRDSRLPSLQHMFLPLPLAPPDVMGRGEGGRSEGFTAFLNLKGDYIDLKLCNLGYTIWMIRSTIRTMQRYFAWDMVHIWNIAMHIGWISHIEKKLEIWDITYNIAC